MSKKSIKKIKCGDCGKMFGNYGGFAMHQKKIHPYIPPPLPKKTTEKIASDGNETLTLLGAKTYDLEVGDIFYRVLKYVIVEKTDTEGSNDVEVKAMVTKKHYQIKKPQ